MQMTIIGRYKNTNDLKNITLKLTGKAGKESRTFNYTNLDFPIRTEENNFLTPSVGEPPRRLAFGTNSVERRKKRNP